MINDETFLKSLFTNLIILFLHSSLVTIICSNLAFEFFNKDISFMKTRKWENCGKIYQDILKIKQWKDKLPELRLPTKQKFKKKSFDSIQPDYIQRFVAETRRAEFTHTIIILGSLVFYFINSFFMGSIIFITATILNLPFIIIQRYNRPRILRISCKVKSDVLPGLINNTEEGLPIE